MKVGGDRTRIEPLTTDHFREEVRTQLRYEREFIACNF